MEIYLVRHGIAEDAGEGQSDDDRALTERGRRRTTRALRGLRRLGVRVQHVYSSPLLRAWQTARLVARHVGRDEPRVEPSLAPGGAPAAVLDRLAKLAPDATVALVGHEPGLGRLATWLTAGPAEGQVEGAGGVQLRKAGVARLTFDGEPRAGLAKLEWLLEPKVLRRVR